MASDEPQITVPRTLPRGRASLPRRVVLLSQRERLREAMVGAVAEKGYGATTIADVIGIAGVSRTTFYEHFRDKEECFVVVYEESASAHLEQIVTAGKAVSDPIEALRAGVRRYLELLAEHPAYAVTCMIEVLAAGPLAARRREEIHDRHVEFLLEWHRRLRAVRPELVTPPREIFQATVGGVNDLVAGWVRAGCAADLLELEGVITALWFAVAGLHEEAKALMEQPRRRRSRRARG